MSQFPLDGITVVSLEQAVSAPFATRQLADLGARVIKVERDTGDFARTYDFSVRGLSSYFAWLNRGKESVVLDLKSRQGRAALESLIKHSDVLVQNLAPGALDRLGFGGQWSLQLNPRLIHASLSGYGEPGEYSGKKAYDLMIQCESGLLSVTGSSDAPAKVGISIADIAAGMYLYSGILTSLFHREKLGHGEIIKLTMLDAIGEWMMQPYLYAKYSGDQPARSGTQHPTIAPYGPFQTRDGVVFFGVQNDREWRSFCHTVLKLPEVSMEKRFSSNLDRVENREELDRVIGEVIVGLNTTEAIARLNAATIANARLRDMADFSAHPQYLAQNRWIDVESPVGPIRMLTPPISSSRSRYRIGRIPRLGEHTADVLRELGITND